MWIKILFLEAMWMTLTAPCQAISNREYCKDAYIQTQICDIRKILKEYKEWMPITAYYELEYHIRNIENVIFENVAYPKSYAPRN